MHKPQTAISTAAAMLTATFVLSACGTQVAATPTQSLPTTRVAADPTTTPSPGFVTAPTPTTRSTPTKQARTTPTAKPTPAAPMFATPQAAMSYLAAAFNARDMVALRHVTTPTSRKELFDMWPGQVHLRLGSCKKDADNAAYVCLFPHDPPKGMNPSAVPKAAFLVNPAARPGWYMSDLLECG
jgi:hypothetical protein